MRSALNSWHHVLFVQVWSTAGGQPSDSSTVQKAACSRRNLNSNDDSKQYWCCCCLCDQSTVAAVCARQDLTMMAARKRCPPWSGPVEWPVRAPCGTRGDNEHKRQHSSFALASQPSIHTLNQLRILAAIQLNSSHLLSSPKQVDRARRPVPRSLFIYATPRDGSKGQLEYT